jgi:hypothetical protein
MEHENKENTKNVLPKGHMNFHVSTVVVFCVILFSSLFWSCVMTGKMVESEREHRKTLRTTISELREGADDKNKLNVLSEKIDDLKRELEEMKQKE